MVYLRGLFVRTAVMTVLLAVWMASTAETASPKIAYRKPIYGKSNAIKEKRLKVKPEVALTSTSSTITSSSTSTTTSTTTEATVPVAPATTADEIASTTSTPVSVIAEENNKEQLNNDKAKQEKAKAEDAKEAIQVVAQTVRTPNTSTAEAITKATVNAENSENEDEEGHEDEEETADDGDDEVATREDDEGAQLQETQQMSIVASTAQAPTTTTTTTSTSTTTTESNLPAPCTCGVFLTSQIRRGSEPLGAPVITNELDRNFPCNPIGQKQCQTKCLETIVQHLPNSANILCATLNRDCHKERAYLFIKNCRNHWWNTSLAAGREYCCKSGQPYPCPMV